MDKQLRPVLVANAILLALIGTRVIFAEETGDILSLIRTNWVLMDLLILGILIIDEVSRDSHHSSYREYGYVPSYHPDPVQDAVMTQEPEPEEVEAPESSEPLQVMACPKCAGPLEFEEGNELTKCAHCGVQVRRRVD